MKVTLVNSLDNRRPQSVDIGNSVTLGDFLRGNGVEITNASIRVGREEKDLDYQLQDGDTVYASPRQIKGA